MTLLAVLSAQGPRPRAGHSVAADSQRQKIRLQRSNLKADSKLFQKLVPRTSVRLHLKLFQMKLFRKYFKCLHFRALARAGLTAAHCVTAAAGLP